MSTATLITGLGAISAAGADVNQTLASFKDCHRDPRPTSLFKTELDQPVFEVASPLPLDPDHHFPSRTAALACIAVEEALRGAGDPQRDNALRIGVSLGTTVASQLNSLEFYREFRDTSQPDLDPVRNFLCGNLAEFVGERFRLKGPRTTVVNACSSGTDAIGIGLSWIRAGLCDLVIAGGADELNRVPLAGFNSLGIMSANPCRPFDGNRDGLNLGEGAGVVILESQSSAAARGIEPNVSLAGYGAACDAYHMTAPHPEGVGLKLAVRSALDQAGAAPADVSFVNAHGTATPDNDKIEGNALAEIFGRDLLFCSTKGRTGHTLGAAGGLEAVFTACGLKHGWIPGNAGFSDPDPEIPINPVTEKTQVQGAAAVSTSLAFGGNNAAIVLRRAG